MWLNLKNICSSISTYPDLSPDIQTRRSINQALRLRPALSLDQWFEFFWRPHGIAKSVVAFVYTHLEKYSGLHMAHVKPTDRLEQDLQLTLVCWFDWQLALCDDFLACFGVDISDRMELYTVSTVDEFVRFLNHQLVTV